MIRQSQDKALSGTDMDPESYIIKDREKLNLIREATLATYFSEKSEDYLESDWGRNDIDANVFGRYNNAMRHVVPWVSKQMDLRNRAVVEIGCGTGSSTAAFAHFADRIDAFDIDGKAVAAAQKRMEILGLKNVAFHLTTPENLLKSIERKIDTVDIILLFAVLEHMTINERHETILHCWDMLPEDGLLAVVETPNLLRYFDAHTSAMPFFHLLDSELCARYAVKSPRAGFGEDFAGEDMSHEETHLKMARWGRGVSYHDFELTIGDGYASHIVSNGYEPEILSWFGVTIEEDVLRYYVHEKKLGIPPAFMRGVLNFILKKNGTGGNGHVDQNVPEIAIGNIRKALEMRVASGDGSITDAESIIARDKVIRHQQEVLDEVYGCASYKIGHFLTSPYRILKKIFRG